MNNIFNHPNKNAAGIMLSAPVPGQSWLSAPKSTPWQKPPVHVDLEDAMTKLHDTLLEPVHLKTLLGLMDSGMPITSISKTILFTGFTLGKWTPSLMLLMFKPLTLLLTVIAHRADMKHTPMIEPEKHEAYHTGLLNQDTLFKNLKTQNENQTKLPEAPPEPEQPSTPPSQGFMQRPQGNI